jgi:cyclophilin family peptidyl-prolyl cis-trans isomerase
VVARIHSLYAKKKEFQSRRFPPAPRYTVTGMVVEGMDVVDELQVDDRIHDMKVLR